MGLQIQAQKLIGIPTVAEYEIKYAKYNTTNFPDTNFLTMDDTETLFEHSLKLSVVRRQTGSPHLKQTLQLG